VRISFILERARTKPEVYALIAEFFLSPMITNKINYVAVIIARVSDSEKEKKKHRARKREEREKRKEREKEEVERKHRKEKREARAK
jgi:phosphate/sulfate permease